MEELYKQLELRIKTLLNQREVLYHSNQRLSFQESKLLRTIDLLTEKHQQAVAHIESVMTKLKTIEKLI